MAEQKQLQRNMQDKMVAGVAAGVADYFDIDALIVRIVIVLFAWWGPGLLAYIVLWLIMPEGDGGTVGAADVDSAEE